MAVLLISLLFMGLVQISLLYTAKEVVQYASNKGARARTVGLNNFMIYKTVRVGTIPNAGKMVWPEVQGGPIEQSQVELANIPWYLGAPNPSYLPAILDYDNWSSVSYNSPAPLPGGPLTVTVSQSYPLTMPGHRAFYADDIMPLEGETKMENHYSLYMNDMGW